MDSAGTSQNLTDLNLKNALENSKKEVTVNNNGHCIWCFQLVDAGARFCDSDCSQDYEQDKIMKG